jgi:tRNA A37 methylthiotransferase MiaB
MRRIYIETYGCQMNVSDSELLFGVLGREGYERTDDPAEADVLLVNTCAVRDHAEQRVLGRMGELKRYKRPGDVLGVVGCMAQRLGPRLLERVPQVDLVIGPDGYRGLPELIARARRHARDRRGVQRLGALRGRPAGPRQSHFRIRDGTTRLRLSVHLLRRSDDARPRAQP